MHVGLRLSSAASTTALHTVGVASCVTDAVTALNSQLYEDVSEEEGWRQIREAYQNAKVTWGSETKCCTTQLHSYFVRACLKTRVVDRQGHSSL